MPGLKFTLSNVTLLLPDKLSGLLKNIYSGLPIDKSSFFKTWDIDPLKSHVTTHHFYVLNNWFKLTSSDIKKIWPSLSARTVPIFNAFYFFKSCDDDAMKT